MRVLFCITRSDTVGGAHAHVADMAVWLRSLGHSAEVAVGGTGVYCDVLESRKVPFHVCRNLCRPLRPVRDIAAVLELRRLLQKVRPDIIALHSAKAGLLGRLAAWGLGIPVVFTAHGWAFTEGVPRAEAKFYLVLERLAARLAHRIITVSEYDRSLAIANRVGTPDLIVAIPNAVPEIGRVASVGHRVGPVRMVMIARLDAQKDHHTLFSALSGLRDREWVIDLVGDGPLEGQIRAAAVASGIAEKVRFLGLRRDVHAILAESQLFVLSSNWEGFPISILEAMRAGLPVVATDVGGVSEAVRDGVTGYLVPQRNSSLLAERLRQLIDHPDERDRMGRQGRLDFERSFRFERMADQTLRVYEDLLRSSRRVADQ